LQDLKNISL